MRFRKGFLSNFPSKGQQRQAFSNCAYNIAAVRNRTTFQQQKMKKKPACHIEEGKKSAIVGTEEPSVPTVSTNSELRGKQTLCSHLHPPGEGAVCSQPAHADGYPPLGRTCGRSSACLWTTAMPEAAPGSSVSDARGPLPAVRRFPPPPHKHAPV